MTQTQGIPLIKSGTITTGKLMISSVNGTAFIDPTTDTVASADFLSAIRNNDWIEITDSTRKKIAGFAKAQGSGTFGSNLGSETHTSSNAASDPNGNEADAITGWSAYGTPPTFESEESDKTTGASALHIVANAANQSARLSAVTGVLGTLYKCVADAKKVGTGVLRVSHNSSSTIYSEVPITTSWLTYTNYFTAVVSGTGSTYGYYLRPLVSGDEVFFDNYSMKQVIAPGSTGLTITNTQGGTTYNFGIKDSGFAYNSASSYTYKIFSSTPYSKLIYSVLTTPANVTLTIADGGAEFVDSDHDFTTYIGTDLGSTPYQIVFYDSVGKTSTAYGGATHGGTGMHLMSTVNGTTRNMKYADVGFDNANVAKINVYRTY